MTLALSVEGASLLASLHCLPGYTVLVAFVLTWLDASVGSFFFGAIITSVGVQHVCGGVRATILLLAKAASPPSSASLQSSVDFAVAVSWMGTLLGRVTIVV